MMGEMHPPVDYAGLAAHDAIMQVQALQRRIIRIELILNRLVELVDEVVVGLHERVATLEVSAVVEKKNR